MRTEEKKCVDCDKQSRLEDNLNSPVFIGFTVTVLAVLTIAGMHFCRAIKDDDQPPDQQVLVEKESPHEQSDQEKKQSEVEEKKESNNDAIRVVPQSRSSTRLLFQKFEAYKIAFKVMIGFFQIVTGSFFITFAS